MLGVQVARHLVTAVSLAAVCAVAAPAFGSGEGSKQVAGFIGGARGLSAGGQFTEPSDVAIYRGGAGGGHKIFVTEAAQGINSRVQRLDAHGNFELAWGRDVVRAGSSGDIGHGPEVCGVDTSGPTGCKHAPPGAGAGELRMPTAISVSENSGDVYVMDQGNRRVQRFDLDGRFLSAWGWGVSTGAARFEVCRAGCRAGRIGRAEGNANTGQFATTKIGAITVSPRAPYHVFVGDAGNRRVLEFAPDGSFVRGWGWGVATDAPKFEICTAKNCRRGHSQGHGGWPRFLAADAGGVVYSAGLESQTGIVRLLTHPTPDPMRASASTLVPLTAENTLLGNGVMVGIAIDMSSGKLAVARDPLGPVVVDEVSTPGTRGFEGGASGREPAVVLQDGLTYFASVTGIEYDNGNVYLAKSTKLNPIDPDVWFDDCGRPSRPQSCNGLVLLSPPGRADTVVVSIGGSSSVAVNAEVVSNGVARYRFQRSRDGRSWRNIARARYVSGSRYVPVSMTLGRHEPDSVYRVRVVVSRRTLGGSDIAISNSALVMTR